MSKKMFKHPISATIIFVVCSAILVVFTIVSIISSDAKWRLNGIILFGTLALLCWIMIIYGLTYVYFTNDRKIVKRNIFGIVIRDQEEIKCIKISLNYLADCVIEFKDGKKWKLMNSRIIEETFKERGIEIVKKVPKLKEKAFENIKQQKIRSISKTSILLLLIVSALELLYVAVALTTFNWEANRETLTLVTLIFFVVCILVFYASFIGGTTTFFIDEDMLVKKNLFVRKNKRLVDIKHIERKRFIVFEYYILYFEDGESNETWDMLASPLSEALIESFWDKEINDGKK